MKASEYGGSDTHKTNGIQPDPHPIVGHEEMRLIYATDPADEESAPKIDMKRVGA